MRMVFVLLAAASILRAEVSLAPLFRDGAVLQRERPVPVWGKAASGEQVTITLGKARASGVADAAGRWRVMLPARKSGGAPLELRAEGTNRIVVHDVVFGDVWLCSGQSNMQMSAASAQDAAAEDAVADYPLIRQFKVAPQFAPSPRDSVDGKWEPCTPSTFGSFSAVGIFFARELWRELGLPIGIVNSSYGNTPISSWREPAAMAAEPVVRRWWSEQVAHQPPPRPHREPSACYNGMIHPLEPYAIRGVLWYQGESDATERELSPIYARQLAGLIGEWRRAFGQPDLPFFWVQLAGYGAAGSRAWVKLREEQTATLAVPHTGQAIAIDVGDPRNIHPRNKESVGERLALLALHRVYGRDVEDTGPEAVATVPEKDGVRIRFAHAGDELMEEGRLAETFELAGADGRFVAATDAKIDGDSVVVRAREVPQPRTVRFSCQNLPPGALYNADGLPAAPFIRPVVSP